MHSNHSSVQTYRLGSGLLPDTTFIWTRLESNYDSDHDHHSKRYGYNYYAPFIFLDKHGGHHYHGHHYGESIRVPTSHLLASK